MKKINQLSVLLAYRLPLVDNEAYLDWLVKNIASKGGKQSQIHNADGN